MKKQRILNIAAQQAEQSKMIFRHGAVLTKSSKILARGYNSPRSHFMKMNNTCLHAEMDTILGYCSNILHINLDTRKKHIYVPQLKKCTLWVVRISKNNTFTESKPCCDCLAFIKRVGIKRIGYTTSDGCLKIENTSKISSTHLSHAQKAAKKVK